jgi:hypothetical protein
MINELLNSFFIAKEEVTPTTDPIFQLPIAHLEQKSVLEEHTITDLELLPLDPKDSLYTYVFKPDTLFGQGTIPLWSKYYTPDTTFLKDSQTLLQSKMKAFELKGEMQERVAGVWQEIQSETGFAEKYSYIEWGKLASLNNNAKFLQCLSMYNMTAPLFSLMLPIFFLILPLLIIKLRGLPMSIEKYIELLKFVFKKHQLGQIFDLSKASLEKIIYVVASGIFYLIQIYQNIMSCRKFYHNMAKIHEQLFIMRDYLETTITNMDILKVQCASLKSYEPFIQTMLSHREICQYVLDDFNKVSPNKLRMKKLWEIGHTMKCFYQLYKNPKLHATLQYTFGLNGYIDNLCGLRKNMAAKHMNQCVFKKSGITKFTKAYFPSLVNAKPVKNTYKIDKHLIITGPNAAGKTTLLKATIFNIIISQQVGYGFYQKATIVPYDMIHCYINIPDTSARDSLFQAEAKRCKDILSQIEQNASEAEPGIEAGTSEAGTSASEAAGTSEAGKATFSKNKKMRHFCVFDELYSGTNPYEAISSAYAYLKYLNKYDNVNFVLTTHFLDLCRRLEKEREIHNFHMKIETVNDDFKYTYKLKKGISYIKGGIKVLKDLDYPAELIKNTSDTLQELDI